MKGTIDETENLQPRATLPDTDSPIIEEKDENKGRRETENVKRKTERGNHLHHATTPFLHFGINKVTVPGVSRPNN